jgi:hypothetical protein
MATSLSINGLPYQGPNVTAEFSNSLANGYVCPNETLPFRPFIPTSCGLFRGSLSAHGNLIAMTTNEGTPNFVNTNGVVTQKPYLSGFLREYWRNPVTMTLGANSPIPAITTVIPSKFSPFSGNLLYFIDLQLTRICGNNFFDNFSFINVFNQVLNWVVTSNNYLAALKNSEQNNLEYYGSTTYQEFLSQGFSKYKQSSALKLSLNNLGKIVTEINSGHFGTSNSIANIMLKSGLGNIGNLTAKLNAENINLNNIYNSAYTAQISFILLTITNSNDLTTIQQVLKTNVKNFKSPLDYISIEKTSGIPNDSAFQSLYEFGVDIKQRTPFLSVQTGQELVAAIDSVLDNTTINVEILASEGKLLPKQIIDQMREFLPINTDNKPVSMLNVIGMASGYLTADMNTVNEMLLKIEQSSYGSQIHSALDAIGETWKSYIASRRAQQTRRVATTYFTKNDYDVKVQEYNTLLETVVADPALKDCVTTLNEAYDRICQATYIEVTNFDKANFSSEVYRENTQIYNFVNSMQSYATDSQNIGTDTILFGMAQPNIAGDTVKSILNQYKNSQELSEIGVKITGSV